MRTKDEIIATAEQCARVQMGEVPEKEAAEICHNCHTTELDCDGYNGPGAIIRELLALLRAEQPQGEEPERITRESILDAAKRCVCGDRERDYGSPENNFGFIAELWTAYSGGETIFTSADVAAMMILLKLARVSTGYGKSDNWVDIAGYAACGGEIEGRTHHA